MHQIVHCMFLMNIQCNILHGDSSHQNARTIMWNLFIKGPSTVQSLAHKLCHTLKYFHNINPKLNENDDQKMIKNEEHSFQQLTSN